MANTGKFSHIIADNATYKYKLKTSCGKLMDRFSLSGIWIEATQYSFTKPLCPKCAALKLIAETSSTEAK